MLNSELVWLRVGVPLLSVIISGKTFVEVFLEQDDHSKVLKRLFRVLSSALLAHTLNQIFAFKKCRLAMFFAF